eukprot:CAMPEP_0203864556 /NCGR_PEP_ID=MMETSP0359-20131031/14838_1 /ASSEMBLY_ACC=CAM_ASM_000338 /TAXON_ID=268821 /ORGANISM="Scrippsiella Hangoei, Strain SHTV-5" /LENGTH=379 /DNA_ID=CAMNT_0050782325 /DNA_START=228 /DNA_END=1367 /DNA_ORIENTATION=+
MGNACASAKSVVTDAEHAPYDERKGAKSLLVVDTRADPEGTLADAALATTWVVKYDSSTDTAAELGELVHAAHLINGYPFAHVGLVTHGGPVWSLAEDVKAPCGTGMTLKTIMVAQPVMSVVVAAVAKDGKSRIDLLGCSLLKDDPALVVALERLYGVNFAASDDETGSMVAGGDWVMESDQVNVIADYFDAEAIKNFRQTLLGLWDFIDMVPVIGGTAGVLQSGVPLAQGDTEGSKDAIANAGLNFAVDALGLVTGGAGKVAVVAAKTGAKVVVKAVAKAAVKGGFKAASKNVTAMKQYAKKYFKETIRPESAKAMDELLSRTKAAAIDVVRAAVEELGELAASKTKDAAIDGVRAAVEELGELAATIAEADPEHVED